MNEWYIRDCSRKTLISFQARSDAGQPLSGIAPYGYNKDPKDIHHWIIDEEAAAIVSRIFNMTVGGKSP